MPTHKNKALKEKQEAEKFRKSEVSRLNLSLPVEPSEDKNVGFILNINCYNYNKYIINACCCRAS